MLWDVDDQRGWLINGSSALLHLLRASLEFNKTDEFVKFEERDGGITVTFAPIRLNLSGCHTIGTRPFNGESGLYLLTGMALHKGCTLLEAKAIHPGRRLR